MSIDRFQNGANVQVAIFANAKAGSGKGRELIPELERLLEHAGVRYRRVHTPAELIDYVSSETTESIVVAAGGDGTIALAATTIDQTPTTAIIPMPLGTENLLARYYGFRPDASQILQTIRFGQVRRIDSGLANGRPFLIMASCGFDAEVVRAVDLRRRGHITRASYGKPILRALMKYRFPLLKVTLDGGEVIECRWAMAFNLPCYGGKLRIEPEARDDDGVLDVITFAKGSTASTIRYVMGVFTQRHLRFPDVTRRKAKTVQIESDRRVPYQLDGDYAGHLPVTVQVRPQSVPIVMPPSESD